MRFVVFIALIAAPLMAQPEQCRSLRKHGKLADSRACYQRLTTSNDPAVRAEGFMGIERFEDANNEFRAAVKLRPTDANIRVRWGHLFMQRFNKAEAATLFEEALQLDKNNTGAMLGLARIASDRYEAKAVELANKALEIDPKLLEAQELLAELALEDNDYPKAIAEADKALKISPEALDAMAVRATVDLLADKPTEWMDRILKINPVYGEAYAFAGHIFVINRRYEEGIKLYKKALELNPQLWEAASQLGVNLMRLGEETEARKYLEAAYAGNYRDAATANSLTLMDSYKKFITAKTDNTVLRLDKKEADLLKPYFESELKRAIATFEKKYKLKLNKPVQVEVYPDHEDFAVRTLGLPGLGALGVTFGHVVAMDSPSGRRPGTFHWASTLWHELSHVFVLTATNHKVPRWFTEGMAVHEETAVAPDWGDRLDPEVIKAIKEKKLLPVATLDRGFIRPSYPSQVVVSYFQAGRICDFINQKWGYDKLLEMMHSFGKAKPTAEVVEQSLGMKPEEFDKQFLAWLDQQVGKTVAGFDEWRKRVRGLAELAKTTKYDEIIKEGLAIRDLYPDYVEAESVYETLANAYVAKGDKENAIKQLEAYSKTGGRNPAVVKKLATMLEEAGRKADAAAALQRLNYVYPIDEELHKRLGDLWLAQKNYPGAIMEYEAVVASKPIDQAASRYNLARALREANRIEDAKEQLLIALEAAPGYRPAQKLLLEMNQ